MDFDEPPRYDEDCEVCDGGNKDDCTFRDIGEFCNNICMGVQSEEGGNWLESDHASTPPPISSFHDSNDKIIDFIEVNTFLNMVSRYLIEICQWNQEW